MLPGFEAVFYQRVTKFDQRPDMAEIYDLLQRQVRHRDPDHIGLVKHEVRDGSAVVHRSRNLLFSLCSGN